MTDTPKNLHDLVDIATAKIDHTLPPQERIKDYLRQTKNPYCYIDNGIAGELNLAPKGGARICRLKNSALFEFKNMHKTLDSK